MANCITQYRTDTTYSTLYGTSTSYTTSVGSVPTTFVTCAGTTTIAQPEYRKRNIATFLRRGDLTPTSFPEDNNVVPPPSPTTPPVLQKRADSQCIYNGAYSNFYSVINCPTGQVVRAFCEPLQTYACALPNHVFVDPCNVEGYTTCTTSTRGVTAIPAFSHGGDGLLLHYVDFITTCIPTSSVGFGFTTSIGTQYITAPTATSTILNTVATGSSCGGGTTPSTPTATSSSTTATTTTTQAAATSSSASTFVSTSLRPVTSVIVVSDSSGNLISSTSVATISYVSTGTVLVPPTHISSSSGISTGTKAGIGAGVAVGALFILAILAALYVRRKRQDDKYQSEGDSSSKSVREVGDNTAPPSFPAEIASVRGTTGGEHASTVNHRSMLSTDNLSGASVAAGGGDTVSGFSGPVTVDSGRLNDDHVMPRTAHDDLWDDEPRQNVN